MIDRLYKVYSHNGLIVAREYEVKECKMMFKIMDGWGGYEQLKKEELRQIAKTRFMDTHTWCVREDVKEMIELVKRQKLEHLTRQINELQDERKKLSGCKPGFIKFKEDPGPRIEVTDDMF